MTEEPKGPDQRPSDVPEGFDLPAETPAPPPTTDSGEPPRFEPHVRWAERHHSPLGKLVALIVIPAVAVGIIVLMQLMKIQKQADYQNAYVVTVSKFLKGLSDDTAESVPAAYGLLHRDVRENVATEAVVEEYQQKTRGLGKFRKLASIRWEDAPPGQASTSFSTLAEFEQGRLPMWFKLAGRSDIVIVAYRLGAP